MDVLASAYDSDDASSPNDDKKGETSGLNFEESASVLQAIKEKYTPDSAPRVADKVNAFSSYVSLLNLKNVGRIYKYFREFGLFLNIDVKFCL